MEVKTKRPLSVRALAVFLSGLMLMGIFSIGNVNAFATDAADGQTVVSSDSGDISVSGTNGFGNLLSDELEEKANEIEENKGNNIFSVEMSDNVAIVSFQVTDDCTLVVGIYDEQGTQMLASGSIEVISDEEEAFVDIETEDMPEYFYVKAFLVDTVTFRPLCTVYESSMYTQEMQKFLAKTTADFDEEKVLNFDEDTTNNFAVYNDNTKIIPQSDSGNEVASIDDENGVYIIENADESITSLQVGDIFAYDYGDDNLLIVKVASISIDDTTATITGEETSMEEVFDYVKIDEESSISNANIDPSTCDEGIVYNGLIDDEE